MNYELAKELKDAGFPQPQGNHDGEKIRGHWYTTAHKVALDVFDINDPTPVYIPTLTELIEACGEKFETLQRIEDMEIGAWWRAYPTEAWWAKQEGECWDMDCCGYNSGDTPEEAIARLWLALNKHD